MIKNIKSAVAIVVLGVCHLNADTFHDSYGSRFQSTAQSQSQATLRPVQRTDAIRYWNQIACDVSGLDHTPVAPGEVRVFGEQLGPCRASRALAIVHIAMFDAMNAIVGGIRDIPACEPFARILLSRPLWPRLLMIR
jgi:hypothetical protein